MKCRVKRDTTRTIPNKISCYISENRLLLGQCIVRHFCSVMLSNNSVIMTIYSSDNDTR